MSKKILILAGGGGHTGYARIIAQYLFGRAELHFLVPEDDPLSKNLLDQFGSVRTLIKPRHPTTPFWRYTPRFFKAFYQSIGLIDARYDFVLSTGSNFCIPPSMISWLKGLSVINLESADRFTRASSTSRILQRFSAVTALQWDDQRKILEGAVFGPFIPVPQVSPWDGGYVLIAGGTYGYKELLEATDGSQLENIVLPTGRVLPEDYARSHPSWRVFSTIEDFHETIAGAKVVVAPPGATPLEAVAYGKRVVVVKYPDWSRAGTLRDAELFAEKLNAPLLSELTPSALVEAINMAFTMEKPVLRNGAETLAEFMLA